MILCERVPFILASGCTVVVKPAEVTSATTLMLADILTEAGLPKGVYNVVTGTGKSVGQALTQHPDVDMLSFTGSTGVGRSCIHASADSNLKKLGLELGGRTRLSSLRTAIWKMRPMRWPLGSASTPGNAASRPAV